MFGETVDLPKPAAGLQADWWICHHVPKPPGDLRLAAAPPDGPRCFPSRSAPCRITGMPSPSSWLARCHGSVHEKFISSEADYGCLGEKCAGPQGWEL